MSTTKQDFGQLFQSLSFLIQSHNQINQQNWEEQRQEQARNYQIKKADMYKQDFIQALKSYTQPNNIPIFNPLGAPMPNMSVPNSGGGVSGGGVDISRLAQDPRVQENPSFDKWLQQQSEIKGLNKPDYMDVPASGSVFNKNTGKVEHTAPPKPAVNTKNPDWKAGINPQNKKNEYYDVNEQKWTGIEVPRGMDVIGGTQGFDADAIAQAIAKGEQAPTFEGLSRGQGGIVRAKLAKMGYNQAVAEQDWKATTKHFATLNGTQQTRLRQSAITAQSSLGIIEDLANQWDGGKFPLLNKVQLSLAKNGALGEKAQSIATRLEAQITDVTSELGNVYMGGNSPTDHALSLAGKNLSANWTKQQLKDAINLARTNLKIRLNSISNTQTVTSSGDSPYGGTNGNQQPTQRSKKLEDMTDEELDTYEKSLTGKK